MQNQDETLKIIKSLVNSLINDSKVLLFGSRARNDYDSDSDYDILVIVKQELSIKEKLLFKTKIRKGLLKFGIRSDVLIQTDKEVETKKKLSGHIIKSIMKQNILL